MPTLLILLFTLFIMVTVIPYAFSSVIKQLRAVQALEAIEAAGLEITQRTQFYNCKDQLLSETAAQDKLINDTESHQISKDSQ